MPKPKTYFEQVPLEVVERIVEKEAKKEKASEQPRMIKNKKLREGLLAAGLING
jgi:hypothetical protein